MGKRKRKHGDMGRREFLYLALGGTTALFGASTCGITAWALQPRLHMGVELFSIDLQKLPLPDERPLEIPTGNFFLTNTKEGLRALCRTCPHKGVTMKWVHTNNRFECPAHGRKHTLTGEYIEGPLSKFDQFQFTATPWSVDDERYKNIAATDIGMYQFNVEVKTPTETRRTDNHAIPINIQDATSIVVDVRVKIIQAPLKS